MFGSWPNIQGWVGAYGLGNSSESNSWSGAFSVGDSHPNMAVTYGETADQYLQQDLAFQASNSNETYAGTKVQPSALLTLPCIRV